MHEMNTLVTFFVISGIYVSLFYLAEVIVIGKRK